MGQMHEWSNSDVLWAVNANPPSVCFVLWTFLLWCCLWPVKVKVTALLQVNLSFVLWTSLFLCYLCPYIFIPNITLRHPSISLSAFGGYVSSWWGLWRRPTSSSWHDFRRSNVSGFPPIPFGRRLQHGADRRIPRHHLRTWWDLCGPYECARNDE